MERSIDSKDFARLASDPNAASTPLSPTLSGSIGMGGTPARPTANTTSSGSPSGNNYGRR
ncbi:hypothetical protein [Deinococcus sp.]|uniref:hypothetical protein n=1 Tax=Deinococcus sp. TaxID=47478 RepID=UPI0038D45B36